jgi:heat shock protein HslJ
MKSTVGFAFFLLFLAGFALVYLMKMGENWENSVPTVDELSASAWRPSHIGEMAVDDDSEIFVQFETDGKLSGNGGCNRFFGSYSLDGNKIHVDPIGITRRACPEPAMSFESSFVNAMQLATVIVGQDTRVAFRNEHGQSMVRLDAIDRQDPQ